MYIEMIVILGKPEIYNKCYHNDREIHNFQILMKKSIKNNPLKDYIQSVLPSLDRLPIFPWHTSHN